MQTKNTQCISTSRAGNLCKTRTPSELPAATLEGSNVADVASLNKLPEDTPSVFIDFEMIEFNGLSCGA